MSSLILLFALPYSFCGGLSHTPCEIKQSLDPWEIARSQSERVPPAKALASNNNPTRIHIGLLDHGADHRLNIRRLGEPISLNVTAVRMEGADGARESAQHWICHECRQRSRPLR